MLSIRVIVQIAIFGFAESIYKYKFIFYLKNFLFETVNKRGSENNKNINIKEIRKIEVYMIEYFAIYLVKALKFNKDNELKNYVHELIDDIVLDGKYKGYLTEQESVIIFSKIAIKYESEELKSIINSSINFLCDFRNKSSSKYTKNINIDEIRETIKNVFAINNICKKIDIFEYSDLN